ncbi:hypothetical protein KKC67_02495 [Patescibacteria group bacterium]|nr:hypothetical protein [Patescibacteria group bacterium]MBU0879675.1 hypothetical protein [Patescibacteria group bacterium]MBU0880154.1 hypothetical protein [Patescibacteria group bacterium]MBU1063143.1 hypothetical protein [Patescibacteria group bacterium]MBU1783480.1 hypothetical protein [Patescibacteria group bacterium]
MHDFLLAKEIVDTVIQVVNEKSLKNIKSIFLEIGSVSLAHDGFEEHMEDISLENLEFGILNIAKSSILKDVKFNIKKVSGKNWQIVSIETEKN